MTGTAVLRAPRRALLAGATVTAASARTAIHRAALAVRGIPAAPGRPFAEGGPPSA